MGPSLGTSLSLSSTVAEPSPSHPSPSPHLLSCCGVLYGPRPPNRLLYDPCPMAGGRRSWSQRRWLLRGPHKIIPPYHSGPSARHSCWWTLGNPGTHTDKHTQLLSRWFHTQGRHSAHFDVWEIWFWKLACWCVWCGDAPCASFPYTVSIWGNEFKSCVHTVTHAHKSAPTKEHLCLRWRILAQRLIPSKPGVWFRVI